MVVYMRSGIFAGVCTNSRGIAWNEETAMEVEEKRFRQGVVMQAMSICTFSFIRSLVAALVDFLFGPSVVHRKEQSHSPLHPQNFVFVTFDCSVGSVLWAQQDLTACVLQEPRLFLLQH